MNFPLSVDLTDCTIQEPCLFLSGRFSHKFKEPGLMYDIGLTIETEQIVWAHGPFPCVNRPVINFLELYRRTSEHEILFFS